MTHTTRDEAFTKLKDLLGIPFSDEQKRCITAGLEPTVITAAAGTGKTTVMAARVVWLVMQGYVTPGQILGLTFTRKAAGELANRIMDALVKGGMIDESDDTMRPTVATYDAFAASLVQSEGMRLGLDSNRGVASDGMAFELASQALRSSNDLSRLGRLADASIVERVVSLDSALRQNLVTSNDVRHTQADIRQGFVSSAGMTRAKKKLEEIVQTVDERAELLDLVDIYQRFKAEHGVASFADLMADAVRLVTAFPMIGARFRETYPVVLLDEYQDTSAAQAKFLEALFATDEHASPTGHAVMAVGDPFQAIYEWRGASSANIIEFPSIFRIDESHEAQRLTLRTNRRSLPAILTAANIVCSKLQDDPSTEYVQAPEQLTTDDSLTAAGDIVAANFDTWEDELEYVAGDIAFRKRTIGLQWSDIAVLCRTNSQVTDIYQVLAKHDIPVEIVGLGGLLQLPEVATIVSYLHVIDDVTANPHTAHLLTHPRWRIGVADMAALGRRASELTKQRIEQLGEDVARDVSVSLLETIDDLGDADVSGEGQQRLREFSEQMRTLRSHRHDQLIDLVYRVIRTCGVDVEAKAHPRAHAALRHRQVQQFVHVVQDFCSEVSNASLTSFLARIDWEAEEDGLEQDVPTTGEAVQILTVHKAKGLEWEQVYLPGLAARVFPDTTVRDNYLKTAQAIPSDLRGDRETIPHVEDYSSKGINNYGEDLKQRQLLSEHRLAYVAITRAKKCLVATTHAWFGESKEQREASQYFTDIASVAARAGQVLSNELSSVNPNHGVAVAYPWPESLDDSYRERLVDVAAAVSTGYTCQDPLTPDQGSLVHAWNQMAEHLVTEARAKRATPDFRMPSNLSVSEFMHAHRDPEGFAAQWQRRMPQPRSIRASLGERFHLWLEERFGHHATPTLFDTDDPTEFLGEDDDLSALIARFESEPYRDRVPVAVEDPFIAVLGGKQIRGRIDAIFTSDDDDYDYQVVDWKTTNRHDDLQLAIYRFAWAQANQIPSSRVDAVFYNVWNGQVTRPKLPGDNELAEQIVATDNRLQR